MKHSPGFLKLAEQAKTRVREVSTSDVWKKIQSKDDFLLVDVRDADEWDQGHLPSAMHMSKGIIERDIEKKIPNMMQEIVLYCGGGYRSALAADNIQKMGYTNVLSMAGGFRAWTQEERPLSF